MLKDYQPGQTLVEFLAVRKASTATAQSGKKYLNCTLSDGETELNAKQWDFTGETPKENTVIKVKADVEQYNGNNQLVIQQWRPAEPGESDPSKFIGKCPVPLELMLTELGSQLTFIQNQILSTFVHKIIDTNYEKFTTCPGAMKHHHSYIGGLFEHTLNVTARTLLIAQPGSNRDLLIAGGLLHDIGKIFEYDWSGCSIQMTTEGKLCGHIVIGVRILQAYVGSVKLDSETYLALLHMIVSHHGKLEWGSPVEPAMKEAFALHQADVMDAHSWKIQKAEKEATGEWTDRIYGIGREFYVYRPKNEDERD